MFTILMSGLVCAIPTELPAEEIDLLQLPATEKILVLPENKTVVIPRIG